MASDDLIRALGQLAKQDPALDPRWRGYCEGTLADRDRTALDSLAQRSMAGRDAREIFQPLNGDLESKLTLSILSIIEDTAPPLSNTRPIQHRHDEEEQTDEPTVHSLQFISVSPLELSAARHSNPPSAPPTTIRPHSSRQRARSLASLVAWIAGVCLASYLALKPAPFAPERPPLPTYSIETTGGDRPFRNQGHGDLNSVHTEIRLTSGSRLEIVLRPKSNVGARVDVRLYIQRDGTLEPWNVPPQLVERHDSGAVRVVGTREMLFPATMSGPYELVFAIGHPQSLPTDIVAMARILANPTDVKALGMQLLRHRVILESSAD